MSEGMVLPEWGIHLRNMVDRMVPVINEDHQLLHEQKATIQRLEREVAMLRSTVQELQTTVAVIRATTLEGG